MVFGEGYVSTGGEVTTREFVPKLRITPGDSVLDIGCGIGGGDFLMAREYGAHVLGIDLSRSMLTCASQLYGDFAAVNVSHTQLNSPRIDWRKDT